MKTLSIFSLLIISYFCNADYLENLQIKKIVDGDTVHVFYQDDVYKVRLTEIDAPERNQPFGKDSTEFLISLLKEGKVNIDISGTDRYGRKLGRLYWKGRDINQEMVIAGYAWVYDDYVTDKSFYENQSKARELRKGLWKDSNSIPPWEWRKRKKQ
ncbi:thermonuclease family protein [Gammaproteobacteria bacterium]|nr:thermonuclease family protein [Gammaproteobacteria bacterium]